MAVGFRSTLFTFLLSAPTVAFTGVLPSQEGGSTTAEVRIGLLQAGGVRTPLTLHPVRVLGRPTAQVAEALGLVLETLGMTDLDVAATTFEVPEGVTWPDVPALFGAHVAKRPPAAAGRHHLYAEFLGTPRTGPEEVRFVVVDAKGQVVLVDRQTPADPDFKRTAAKDPDPLGCATLTAERLFNLAQWKKAPGSVRDGKFGKGWKERSGVPDDKEFAAMKQRLAVLRADLAQKRLVVLPTVVGGGHDAASAARIAGLLEAGVGGKVAAPATGERIVVAPGSNEQKRLWDLARGLRAVLPKSAVDADYVLVADLGVDAAGGHAYVHVALCTAAGEWVVVDFQNDQSPLLQKAMPRTLADAERLLVERLRALLQ